MVRGKVVYFVTHLIRVGLYLDEKWGVKLLMDEWGVVFGVYDCEYRCYWAGDGYCERMRVSHLYINGSYRMVMVFVQVIGSIELYIWPLWQGRRRSRRNVAALRVLRAVWKNGLYICQEYGGKERKGWKCYN
jgi:hypothetical protein